MRIWVTGGAGFIGSHLVESLAAEGHQVISFDKRFSEKRRKGVVYIQGDVTNKKSLAKIFKKIDVVYHLAAILGKWGIPEEMYWKVNYQSTKDIFDLCIKTKVKQLVYPGSAGTIGPYLGKPLKENSPYELTNDPYKKTKIESEKFLLSKLDSMPITIVRPELVYGPGDLNHLGYYIAIKARRFIMPCSGKNFIHPTFVDDIVQGLKLVLMNEKAFGQKFIFAGKEVTSSRKFFDLIAKTLETSIPKITIPFFISKFTAFTFEFLGKNLNFKPPLTNSNLEIFSINKTYDISFAKKRLGYKPTIGLKDGIRRTVNWYRKENLL